MPTYYTATDRRCKTSALEQQILDQLEAAGLPVVPQVKLRSWVFDAALQGTWVLIEVNGAYWHSQPHAKVRDARKQAWCAEVGYTLVTIQEADYQRDPAAALQPALDAWRDAVKDAPTPDTEASRVSGVGQVVNADQWPAIFLQELSQDGIVLKACRAAQITRATAYERRQLDPDFARAWKLALQDAADRLREVYQQRAVTQSDRALEFLLRTLDPDTYRDSGEAVTIRIDWSRVPTELLNAYLMRRITIDDLTDYKAN